MRVTRPFLQICRHSDTLASGKSIALSLPASKDVAQRQR